MEPCSQGSLFLSHVWDDSGWQPQDIEILGWCPAGSVFPHRQEEGASLALVGHSSTDGITIKIPYGVNVLLH